MSKFSKLIRLLVLLKSEGRMKSKDISLALGISERMVRKYIQDLIEAGIDVISITGPMGGYEINGYDYLLNINISNEEMIALEILYENLNYNEDERIKNNIKSLIDKLRIQSSNINKSNEFSNNIVLNSNATNLTKQNTMDANIHKCIFLNRKINIDYISAKGELSNRIIHPYDMITRNNLKYVVAYCENREEVRLFKLVRIHKLNILEDTFKIPEELNLNDLYKENSLGVIFGDDIELKLLIKPPFSYSVSERVYANNQVITWNEDDSIIFEATINGKEDIIRWILSMKSYVTVIRPKELKNEIKQELINMISSI